LPEVLTELAAAGVHDDDVRIVFALGSHRSLRPEERSRLLGDEIYQQYRCLDSVEGPFVEVGRTSRGTAVQVFHPIIEASWRVLIGNIEYHYFAGYTGGAKALLPGVCSLETITANHSWMVDEDACAARIERNPVREDIEEALAFVGPSFLLNVVLDHQHRIREAVAGDVRMAHRRGCQTVDRLYRAVLSERADIVLASAGGWPKDINLYQAHKALENAARAVRDGGIVILVAACNEGIGHPRFAEWLTSGDSPQELLDRIRERFVLGGHKAAAIAKTLRRGVRVFLVSSLDADLVHGMGFMPFQSAQAALDAARDAKGHSALLALMPHAGSTMPVVAES
jgi:nickel-dependent lactate racemase